ncbi:hypothetical protein AAC387_Pa01g0413 [Persea americana]
MEEDWEMLQKHDMGHPPVPDLAENSRDLEGIEGASEGAVRSDYFSLDSETRYPKRVVEDDREESSIESNNPSWVDPDGGGGGLGFGGIELPRRNYGGSWSDSSSDGSVSRKFGAFDGKPELGYADDAKSGLLVGGIGVERKKFDNFWLDSEVKRELGIGDDAKGEVGSEGIGIKRKISGEFWSDSGSDISIREKHGGGEADSELGWGDLLKTGERLSFGGSAEVEGDEFYGKTNDAPEENEMKSSDAEKKRVAWWKLPLELLKFCTFRISPVWSFSIAAAVVSFFILGRRLYKMKHKSQNIQLRFSLDDKFLMGANLQRVSQFMSRAARLNEAFSVVKRVPIVRASLPATGGVTPWPAMSLR